MTLPTWTRLAEIAEEATHMRPLGNDCYVPTFHPKEFARLLRAEAAKEALGEIRSTFDEQGRHVGFTREPTP